MRFLSIKGQVSMEYMTIMGLSLLLLMPLVVIFAQQSNSLQEEVDAVQIEKIGLSIIDSAEELFFLGSPSQKLLEIYFPNSIEQITIESQAIVFYYNDNESFAAESSLPLNLTGTINIHPGIHNVLIKAETANINISELT